MTDSDAKDDLRRYLQAARDALVWKLDGLSEYDMRRPMTPTGTNLLGLVKHMAGVELGYFGDTFGRKFPESLPWYENMDADPSADFWASEDESRDDIVGLYRRVWAFADETVESTPLDAVGEVPWWPPERRETTLHRVLVHVVAELNRHAGHADIVRELVDGGTGLREGASNLPDRDADSWAEYREKLERVARAAGSVR
ncbi:MAG TPA: DinB family protein [Amycolatopsis sp.]|uniref:DinB family protein n=1 Tax=Amycolatopsis sp. TaxID=37632 RepID=UPI002F430261